MCIMSLVSAVQSHSGWLRVENACKYIIPLERDTLCIVTSLTWHSYALLPYMRLFSIRGLFFFSYRFSFSSFVE